MNTSKPLVLSLKEAETDLVNAVNAIISKHSVPCYLFEPIFDKVHRQIKDEALKEGARAEREYLTRLKEEEEPTEKVKSVKEEKHPLEKKQREEVDRS